MSDKLKGKTMFDELAAPYAKEQKGILKEARNAYKIYEQATEAYERAKIALYGPEPKYTFTTVSTRNCELNYDGVFFKHP